MAKEDACGKKESSKKKSKSGKKLTIHAAFGAKKISCQTQALNQVILSTKADHLVYRINQKLKNDKQSIALMFRGVTWPIGLGGG